MIKIISAEDEYLVALAYADRARAKSIPNYRWDSLKKVWRFPKNQATKTALMSEFGQEAEWVTQELQPLTEEGTKRANAPVCQLSNSVVEPEERTKLLEQLIDANSILLELWDVAETFGLKKEVDLGEFVEFTKAAYAGNHERSDLATQIAVSEAKLNQVRKELVDLKAANTTSCEIDFKAAIVREAWGGSAMPSALQSFSFDGDGAIKLQNHLVKALKLILNPPSGHVSFADLIRSAEDAGAISNSAARACHTLRIQRNHFAHEHVGAGECFSRASLCLFSFILVMRELNGASDTI